MAGYQHPQKTAPRPFAFPARPAAILALLAAVSASAEPPAAAPDARRVITGITAPVHKATISTLRPGRIEQLPAPEGSFVRKGELLIALDDRAARAAVQIVKAEAESDARIDLARARLEWAQADLQHMQRLSGDAYASTKELSDAESLVKVRRNELEVAVFERAQSERRYEREQLILAEHRVTAPFDGYVAQHHRAEGESVEEREGVLEIAQLDPLLVVVDCPIALATGLREGQLFRVAPVDAGRAPRAATVTLVNRVADAASQTVRVKLTVANADQQWISGLKVTVDFSAELPPDDSAAAAPRNGQ